ncbi:MAG: extracellular solute-binding protein family 1 [Paenibacillus sp.]|nr:extracellular solute-binding protein family 1 [Paenibacillus sp.]
MYKFIVGVSIMGGLERKSKLSAVLLATALLASACSGGGDKQTGEGSTAPKPQEQAPKPVKLQVLAPSGVNEQWFMDRYGKSIQAKYPHYSFEVLETNTNTIQAIVTEKRKIDLIITSFAGLRSSIKPVELHSDLNELIKKHGFDTNRVEKAYLDTIQNLDKGKTSGLPLYDLSMLLYYNKDIFDKFGVPYLTDKMTWEDLLSVANRLTRVDGSVQYRGFVTAASHLVVGNQASLGFFDPTGDKVAIDAEKWKQYFELMKPFYTMPGYNATKPMISGNAIKDAFFKEKTSAMFVMYNSDAPKPEDGMNWDAVKMPELKSAPGVGSQPYPVYIDIASTSEHRDEAFLSLAVLLTDEVQTMLASDFAYISPLKSQAVKAAFGKNAAQWKGKNIGAITALKPASPPAYVGEYYTIGQTAMTNAMLSYFVGEKDVNTAIRDATEETAKKLEEEKAKKK